MKSISVCLAILLGTAAMQVGAADFDGSKRLICATIDAHACDPGIACTRALPADLGLPKFLTLDFDKRAVVGPARTTPMLSVTKEADQLLILGNELGFGWTLVVDSTDGEMTLTIANRNDAFVLFGNCTPL
ncbi:MULTISPECIES: hypothetical protein [Paraburkholderia]|uniref:Uncharacterized protein n=1 Tax=Paraburkholderia tuberum TaxID=157910 RepID=A0A1H1JUS9_9BURK|nr:MULTISPECIES: hypothetical protein [Paraburkholderia]MBB5410212.1 hypothetical protein [Paraburkholderia sp. HC6.4b]MBB5443853.1 hypothetical protein [Paraburkholderia sp. WSM4177]MBB5452421.1 hypothetical protein [Paraburkholderia sp. Kb1A]MBB5460481.1 hypothetical protein [Paraburkholderia sp. Cpub6]MBB5485021.1 hypothetical protein [Paraburkholderia sp. WSM4180]